MLGIHIAAVIAAVLALGVVGVVVVLLGKGRHWVLLAILVLVELPMSAIGILVLRKPLDGALRTLSLDPGLLQVVQSCYAPVIEEPLKLLPLVVPLVFRRIDPRNGIAAGLALGLGFGIGEIGYLASAIANVPQYAALGPAMFSGFIVERLLACFLHGAMTATVIWLWLRGARWGILVGMAMHYALNFPIFLGTIGVIALPRGVWTQIAFAWVVVATIVLAFWVVWMVRKPPPHRGQPAG